MHNTFEKYAKSLRSFIDLILEDKPDYIVPVKKKGCKLLRYANIDKDIFQSKVRYRDFFENSDIDLSGKKVAVLDDATKFTSSLWSYRNYFEDKGAFVRTYSFVGQNMLKTGEREQYDKDAVIFQYLEESTYQEYIVQQSFVLSKTDSFYDIDHFAINVKMPSDSFNALVEVLDRVGEIDYTNDVYTPAFVQKICVSNIGFRGSDNLFPSCVSQGILQKIRIAYNSELEELTVVPLSFPKWNSNTDSNSASIFRNVDIILPYDSSDSITNKGIFFNIVYVYQLCLLRHFVNKFSDFDEFRTFSFVDQDMIAFVGTQKAHSLFRSAREFVFSTDKSIASACSVEKDIIDIPRKGIAPFPSVISIMEELRGKYNTIVDKAHSLIDVRYFISFEEMIERYSGRENLYKWIDILCDRGALVTRNYCENGIYFRACRSGELNFDHIQKRTGALVSLAINSCATEKRIVKGKEFVRINSTYLNKVLANFAYDYPSGDYDVHSLYTIPHQFGPLVYAEDSIKEKHGVSLYRIKSDLFTYDEEEKVFVSFSVKDPDFGKLINSRIGRHDSVPYSEIMNYFGFIKQIRNKANKDAILNALIICRNEDMYYKHVFYNLSRGYDSICEAMMYRDAVKCDKLLRDAAENISSANEKLEYNQVETIALIKAVDCDLVYEQTRDMILDSFLPYSDGFLNNTIPLLNQLCVYEKLLVNILLFKELNSIKYFRKFIKIYNKNLNDDLCISIKDDIAAISDIVTFSDFGTIDSDLYSSSMNALDRVVSAMRKYVFDTIARLPKINHTYSAEQRHRNTLYAKNLIKRLVGDEAYERIVLVYYSYSGFKNITDAKDINVIDTVQKIAASVVNSGRLIFGATGDEPFGLFATDTVQNALDFSQRLTKAVSLLGHICIRFGCSVKKDNSIDGIETVISEAMSLTSFLPVRSGFVLSELGFSVLRSGHDLDGDSSFAKVNKDNKTAYILKEEDQSDNNANSNLANNVKIGIITVLLEEYTSVRVMLADVKPCVFPGRGSGHKYDVGDIVSPTGVCHKIALTRTIGDGNNHASYRAANMIAHFPNLEVIFMVGIAGGTPVLPDEYSKYSSTEDIIQKHVRLGDIVIGNGIFQYDYVKETIKELKPKGFNIPPLASVLEAKQYLDYLEETTLDPNELPWNKYTLFAQETSLKSEYKRPSPDKDILRNYNGEIVPHPDDKSRYENLPKVFLGKIASANRVLKNRVTRDKLKEQENVLAVEMETSGIADATWEASIGYFAVRGIVDYCDEGKNDIWHRYSALVAAAYTKALIENMS